MFSSVSVSFRTKIFIAIFVPSLLLLSLLAISIGYSVSKQMRTEYIERYRNLTSVISDTLQQLEQSAEVLARAGAQYLSLYYEKNGLPSEEKLKSLQKDLGVSLLCITDRNGYVVRDTINPPGPTRNFSLFELCPNYQNLVDGQSKEETTPILPSFPVRKTFKLVMLPAPIGKGIVEAGVEVNSIGNILKKSLRSDKNLMGLGLFTPNGKKLGYFGKGNLRSTITSLFLKNKTEYMGKNSLIIIKKVTTPYENCCECNIKHLTNSDNRYFYLLVSKISLTSLHNSLKILQILLTSVLLGSILIAFFLANYLSKYLVKRVNAMGKTIRKIMDTHDLSLKVKVDSQDEIAELAEHFNQMTSALAEAHQMTLEMEKAKALEKLTQRVAHDLGSPLMSLNSCIAKLDQVPENIRLMTREAIIRINDISRDLLDRHKIMEEYEKNDYKNTDKFSPELLIPMIESILTEKRMQFHSRHNIQINFSMEADYYGLFVAVQPMGLKRVLSNIINNAVESIEHNHGLIEVSLIQKNEQINIVITDNGKGIPSNISEKLKKESVSYGKKDGHGIGLRHAFESLAWWDGTLDLQSTLGEGSTIIITLPKIAPPSWFVPTLIIPKNSPVIILDDDSAIHNVWETQLEGAENILHCYTASDFEQIIKELEHKSCVEQAVFLCDYELNCEKKTGLDLIIQYYLNKQAILVTSRYEEPALRQRCESMNVRFLPKSLALYLPIQIVTEVI